MSEKKYDDDDGRTVADMSNLHSSVVGGWFKENGSDMNPEKKPDLPKRDNDPMPERAEEDWMTPQERKWTILGTLKAALLIGAVFMVGLGLVIVGLVVLWNII